ncbi:MAG: hypothetical protein AB1324_02480 [Candidatus Micrarchaeota archaeon]
MITPKMRHNVELARPSMGGASFREAFVNAGKEGRRLISNRKAEELLGNGGWIDFEYAFPVWTGTVVAYPPARKEFGVLVDVIDGTERYLLDTMGFAGRGGIALVFEPGTYELGGEGNLHIFVPRERPLVIENFPQESGFPIACGAMSGARLVRTEAGGIFAAVRDRDHIENPGRKDTILLNSKFSARNGVLLEGPRGSIPPGPPEDAYLHESGGD